MKIINPVIGILFAVGTSISCSDENELIPTMADQNYFAVPEGLNDPESVLRRDFYDLNKSYLLFNDTLKKEKIGLDHMGNPAYSYVLADPGYSLTMASVIQYRFAYIREPEHQKAAVDFVQTALLPSMNIELKPYAFLLVDTIKLYQYKTNVDEIQQIGITNVVSGSRCMTIASTGQWGKMTEDLKAQLRQNILVELVGSKIKKLSDDELAGFYGVSKDWYEKVGMVSKLPAGTTTFEDLGLLGLGKKGYWYDVPIDAYKFPMREEDLDLFVNALFAKSKEVFYTEYAQYPLILLKYNALLSIANGMGLKL